MRAGAFMTRILYVAPGIVSQCEMLAGTPALLPGPDGRMVVYTDRDSRWTFEGWVEHMGQVGTFTLVQLRGAFLLLRADTVRHPSLTAQEQMILRGIAAGQSYRQMAPQLHLAESTTAHYAKRLRVKFGANDRAHLVAIAKDQGII
jgi:DNA-binding CsgD family transcriptional regulator